MTEALQITDILEAFKRYDGEYKKSAVEAAIAKKEELEPHLIRILENLRANPDPYIDDPDLFDQLYAFMLLGHFKTTAAHPVLVDIFSLPPDIPSKVFGDIWLTYLPGILLDTCGGSLERIKELALNRNANMYARTSALEAMALAVALGMAERMEVLSFYESLFTAEEAEPDSDFWSLMAMSMVDLHPVEIMETVKRAYEEGLIFSGMIRYEDFEKAIAGGPEKGMESLKHEYERFSAADIHKAMSGWACFQDDTPSRMDFPEPDDMPNPHLGDTDKQGRKKKKTAKKKRKMAKASKKKNRR